MNSSDKLSFGFIYDFRNPELWRRSSSELYAETLDAPGQAIDKFKYLQQKVPLEHVMLAVPAGMPPREFKKYANIFADEVIPAFGGERGA